MSIIDAVTGRTDTTAGDLGGADAMSPVLEVPQPTEVPTPAVPEAPVVPAVPDAPSAPEPDAPREDPIEEPAPSQG